MNTAENNGGELTKQKRVIELQFCKAWAKST